MRRDQRIAEQSSQLEEQRSALLISAKAMKTAGIPIEQIAEMTRLSVEEISDMV